MTEPLRCPQDREPLQQDGTGIACPACSRRYILAAFSIYDSEPMLAEVMTDASR